MTIWMGLYSEKMFTMFCSLANDERETSSTTALIHLSFIGCCCVFKRLGAFDGSSRPISAGDVVDMYKLLRGSGAGAGC